MERSFRASPEFQKLKFFRIKNARLADDYGREHFPKELDWLAERYLAREFKKPSPRPTWWIFVDRKLAGAYGGSKQWDSVIFPKIKQIVAENQDK